jgi:hypothetical protein
VGARPLRARPPMAVPSSSPRSAWMMSVTRRRMVWGSMPLAAL